MHYNKRVCIGLTLAAVLLAGTLSAEPLTLQVPSAAVEPCEFTVRIESDKQHSAAGSHHNTHASQQFYALLDRLASKVNCTVRQVALPAGRAIKQLEDGQLDVMVSMSVTPQRQQYSFFVGPHHSERMVVVASHDIGDSVTNLQQLLAVDGIISVTEGAYYGPQWQQLIEGNPQLQARLFAASGNQQKLAMLISGRVFASLEDEVIVDELLKKPNFNNLCRKLFVLHENPVYFAFSRKSVKHELLVTLQQQWQLMLASGEVAQIRQQGPAVIL